LELALKIPPTADRTAVVGSSERHLKVLRDALGISISARETKITLSGSKPGVLAARNVLETLIELSEAGKPASRQVVLDLLSDASNEMNRRIESGRGRGADGETRGWEVDDRGETLVDDGEWEDRLNVYVAGRPVKAKNPSQAAYLRAIRENDLVFGIGPAGTGKTYLAVAAAVHLLKAERVKRVVLVRPAVEAGEKLGFLPGDLREKVNPYLRPLFDALNDMMDFGTIRRFIEHDVVEVAPLAFMRGRTLNQSVVILDEAQNTTRGQMKMFLTRMGHGSKFIVTGDPSQTDLPDSEDSGLIDATVRLAKTKGVGFVGFRKEDVVRHDLVQWVIEAYGDEVSPTVARKRVRSERLGEGKEGEGKAG
jgi:phosphate starvation-inducible PhoH-like protein